MPSLSIVQLDDELNFFIIRRRLNSNFFDPAKTPGLDTWTYGFHPNGTVPMGSGKSSKGYAEMWGGTVQRFPAEKRSIEGHASIRWNEMIVPFQRIGGLSFANWALALKAEKSGGDLLVALCPTHELDVPKMDVSDAQTGRPLWSQAFASSPISPSFLNFANIVINVSAVTIEVWEGNAQVALAVVNL